ncbi:DegT/DnrJ/EryC1/StrS family aminotransferase [Puniceicoccus vermicola]|uniref:Aminotransferase class I/II-fold pyridoxal phosphate-dependent enzyme n=1 Tax=Puniceicoccus vermicola TaxID=388746 RepID=A0A7X1AWC6_9BACT|nr:aminotransferase class I/II-fold pyridoxal phosphate-dependent enzyme [Puniceicoccus vermicola]MBC2601208.1 aminotransferase class I/II-fold pyridoxal phosphate-dependent enzyme [Puniceicoccus vermicola]
MDRIYLSPPDVGPREREALLRAFDSGWVAPVGPEIDAFESEMVRYLSGASREYHPDGSPRDDLFCTALSSGTAALHLALLLSRIEPGDRVLVSDFTFVASANAVRYCGAEPVFLDSDRSTWNLDPDCLAEALETLSREGAPARALICTDLYGQCADYGRIAPLCRAHGISLIQDAAEAVGTVYQNPTSHDDPLNGPAGLQGDYGIFSFNGNKLLTTGGGGMLISKNQSDADRARFLATQAKEPLPHYQHEEVGFNYRMGNLTAAIGRGQLSRLPDLISSRQQTFVAYQEALAPYPEIRWIPYGATGQPNYWLSCLLLDPSATAVTPDLLRKALDAQGIESRPLWKPMHLQPLYRENRIFGGSVSEDLYSHGLCLPSGSGLTPDERNRVIQVVSQTLKAHRSEG